MLRRALGVIGGSLLDLWENIFVLVTANLVWAISLIPGILVGILLGGGILALVASFAVVAVLAGPTTIGLFYMTTDMSRRERAEVSEFVRGVKRFYRRGWLLGGLNAFFAILITFNLSFYSQPAFASSPLRLMNIFWLYIIIAWLLYQLYLWPLAIRMEPDGKLPFLLLLRNAALATFKYLGFSLIIGVVMVVLLALYFVLAFVPLVLFGMVLQTLFSNRAVKVVLVRENERQAKVSGSMAINVPEDLPTLEAELGTGTESASQVVRNAPPGVTQRGTSTTARRKP